jgi:hypothetical protein
LTGNSPLPSGFRPDHRHDLLRGMNRLPKFSYQNWLEAVTPEKDTAQTW